MLKANQIGFLDWIVGFIDAEGCFHIKRKTMPNGKIRYYLEFVIKLHMNDEAVLRAICYTLNIILVLLK